jgi:hypothetical protein
MKTILTIVEELWGLFVDDGTLEVVIVCWLLLVALVLPLTKIPPQFDGAILLLGLILGLIENIRRRARK